MDLKIAWWNCHVSAPATATKPNELTPEFFSVVLTMLDSDVDLLCLCEVNDSNCAELNRWMLAMAQTNPRYKDYTVQSLYSKSGNKIDDYGLIYRADKLSLASAPVDLNSRADVTDKYLKVGRKVNIKLDGDIDLWLILCHWQSLRNHAEDSHVRTEVAQALRVHVENLYDDDPGALIIICGDFNDEPFSRSLQMGLKASRDINYVKARNRALFNPFWRLVGLTDLITGRHLPPGTCSTTDPQHMTNWRTFDQIIISSGFLNGDWCFMGNGVEIMNSINLTGSALTWADLSDHYPVMCNLKRIV